MALMIPHLPQIVLTDIVRRALDEDISRGDLTTSACIDRDMVGKAEIRARQSLVMSGLPVIEEVFRLVDREVRVECIAEDGMRLAAGDVAARLEGRAQSILLGERVALNFAQLMSGIATLARTYTDAIPEGSPCRIADTRKTTPGLRAFERYAVRCGGAHNHRNDLSSAVMIKDNHIAACGGVKEAIERARLHSPHTTRIECEVDRMDQLALAIEAGADIIMLDNFDNAAVAEGIAYVKAHATRPTLVEASGGITLERVTSLAKLGVDVISVGALTHSAGSVDLGMDWLPIS